MGVQLTPRLTVFHTPPEDIATYQTLRFFGSIAMSPTRPGVMHGPIARSSKPLRLAAVTGAGGISRGFGARSGCRAVEVWASASARATNPATRDGVGIGVL